MVATSTAALGDRELAIEQPRSSSSSERFEFTGSGSEYFRIWIVNILLTILTLGIYSAWAKVRRLRYFYGNTHLAGSTFEYHADPVRILKGRLIAAAFLIPYFILYNVKPLWSIPFIVLFIVAMPFLVVKSRQFQTRMTSWRNIRFGFVGSYGESAKVFLGMLLLVPLTLGLIVPYWLYAKHRFLIGKTTFGADQFQFDARVGPYYIAHLAAIGAMIAVIVVASVLGVGGGLLGAFGGEDAIEGAAMTSAVIMGVAIAAGYLFMFAIIQAMTLNEALSGSSIGGHRLSSNLSAIRLGWIYFSNALLTAITLGIYFPWAAVRMAKYQLSCTTLHTAGSLDAFVASQQQQVSATGEEVGDLLDVDFGL